ncbi:transcriptional regulator FtsR [Tessaracoccus caeni]|uniref:transcriptional regulator FtsR n=1 Tax=Tessaracoccus caeni TaxID=3031239 RepID=UPI0023DA68F9|nr:MerR family transcriptional regulator [Tessaracoccus caeni]MDF1488485.1 MerR family transcriptional regulator [Tessaracoccus caeni]
MVGAGRTIGAVLELLRGEFPDITVSKVRYYERVGLITPARDSSSGYRVFGEADIGRLRYALRAQRDRYLPLEVIRAELEALDRGELAPTSATPAKGRKAAPARKVNVQANRLDKDRRWTRRELLDESGLSEATLVQLERMKMISVRPRSGRYGREAMAIARAAARLTRQGVDVRRLRILQQAAAGQAALLDQIFEGYPHGRGPSRDNVQEVLQVLQDAQSAYLQGNIVASRWYRGIHDRS